MLELFPLNYWMNKGSLMIVFFCDCLERENENYMSSRGL